MIETKFSDFSRITFWDLHVSIIHIHIHYIYIWYYKEPLERVKERSVPMRPQTLVLGEHLWSCLWPWGPSTDRPMTLYALLFIIQTNSLCLNYKCILFSLYQYFPPSLAASYIHLIIMNEIFITMNEYKSNCPILFNVVSGYRSIVHYHHMHQQK